MHEFATWPQGWSIVGELDDSFIALAYNDGEVSPNAVWDLGVIDDLTERSADFARLLELLLDATIVDTDTLSGIAVDITEEFNWYQEGRARGLYSLKAEDTGKIYSSNSEDFGHLIELMHGYTENDTESTTEDDTATE